MRLSNNHQPNHECRNCFKKYYVCNDCERKNSWKTVCCSVECYDAYTQKVIRSRIKKAEVHVEEQVGTTVNEETVDEIKIRKKGSKKYNKEVE